MCSSTNDVNAIISRTDNILWFSFGRQEFGSNGSNVPRLNPIVCKTTFIGPTTIDIVLLLQNDVQENCLPCSWPPPSTPLQKILKRRRRPTVPSFLALFTSLTTSRPLLLLLLLSKTLVVFFPFFLALSFYFCAAEYIFVKICAGIL